MEQRKALQYHEIRVIKIDREAILNLIWEIFAKISGDKMHLPCNVYDGEKVCLDMYFDEQQCEIILSAYRKGHSLNKEAFIAYVNNSAFQAVDSLFLKPKNKQYYHSIQDSYLFCDASNCKRSALRIMLKKLGVRFRSLGDDEVRFIRLSQKAIYELLWEHFMETGDNVMDIPVDTDDVVYHMYTEGALQQLTLFVMNLNEVSDKAFADNRAYCDQNIPITTDLYSERCKKSRRYVSVVLPKLL